MLQALQQSQGECLELQAEVDSLRAQLAARATSGHTKISGAPAEGAADPSSTSVGQVGFQIVRLGQQQDHAHAGQQDDCVANCLCCGPQERCGKRCNGGTACLPDSSLSASLETWSFKAESNGLWDGT